LSSSYTAQATNGRDVRKSRSLLIMRSKCEEQIKLWDCAKSIWRVDVCFATLALSWANTSQFSGA